MMEKWTEKTMVLVFRLHRLGPLVGLFLIERHLRPLKPEEKKKTIEFYNSIPCSENKFIQSASDDYLAYQWDHGIGRHCMAWITWMSAFLTSYSCHCEPFLRHSVFSIHHLWARLSWMDGIVMVCEQNYICAYAKPPMKPYNKLYGEGCRGTPRRQPVFLSNPKNPFSTIHSLSKTHSIGKEWACIFPVLIYIRVFYIL